MSRVTKDELLGVARGLEGVLVQTPGPGDGSPEIAWGDAFLYYAPDGRMPQAGQPFATVVTKDYPDEPASGLGRDGRWRVNIGVGRTAFRELTGEDPRSMQRTWDHTAEDVLLPHPVYAALGWVCVVDPGEATGSLVLDLLRQAYERARARAERRQAVDGGSDEG
jgi:hypothetical protein